MAKLYDLKVVSRKQLNDAVMTLELERPDDYSYQAGQYAIIPFEDRQVYMTLASSPTDKHIKIAFRTNEESAFKRHLQTIPIGECLTLWQANGSFILDATSRRPVVLLAGGIGITPFRSMVRALPKESKRQIYLFHSCRTPSEALFADEFQQREKEQRSFRYLPVFTRTANSESAGRITVAKLTTHLPNLRAVDYNVAGSHSFVEGMTTMLRTADVPVATIRTEVFCGYCSDHVCCCDEVAELLHERSAH